MAENANGRHLQVIFQTALKKKTCDIMDPYEIINWVPPRGGDGPGYELL